MLGKSEVSSRLTTCGPAPMAKRISVFEGARDTIRWAGPARVTLRFKPSINVIETGPVEAMVGEIKVGRDVNTVVGVEVGAGAQPASRMIMARKVKTNLRDMIFSPMTIHLLSMVTVIIGQPKSPAEY